MLAYPLKDLEVSYIYKGYTDTCSMDKLSYLKGDAVITDVYLAPTSTQATVEPCPKEEGNIPMYTDTPKAVINSAGAGVVLNASPEVNEFTIKEEQRKYIARLALDVHSDKIQALRDKYKIDFDFRPATVQEAADRLKKGLYTIKGADKKDPVRYSYLDVVFSWRGPDDQADEDGYKAAVEDFLAFAGPLLTEIRIFDPKDGLESFKKLEAYQI